MMPLPIPLSHLRFAAAALAASVTLTGCRTGAFPEYPGDYREYAYVANSGSNTVTVLDVVHMRQQGVLIVAAHPVALAANPARNEIYTASEGLAGERGSLSIIDAETNRVASSIALGHKPAEMVSDSAGDTLYVTNAGSNSVSVVDLHARRLTATTGVGERPRALAISPDNSTLVVANEQSGSVSVLDLVNGNTAATADVPSQQEDVPARFPGHLAETKPAAALRLRLPIVRSTYPGCPGASSVAILPDASKAFIACSGGHQVMVLGLRRSDRSGRPGLVSREDQLLDMLDVGMGPVRLILKPDGGEIFVANRDANTVSEIATGTNEVGGAALIGSRPESGVVSPDNALLWVSNEAADTVAVYSVDDGKLINTVHVGSGPGPVAFSADSHLLLAADTRSGDVSVLRTFSRNLHREPVYGTLFTLLPAGDTPAAIVDKAYRIHP